MISNKKLFSLLSLCSAANLVAIDSVASKSKKGLETLNSTATMPTLKKSDSTMTAQDTRPKAAANLVALEPLENAPAPTARNQAVPAESVMLVDLDTAIMQSNKGKKIAKKVQNKATELQTKLTKKQEEFTKFTQEFKEKEATLSKNAREEQMRKGAELEGKLALDNDLAKREFENFTQTAQEELGKDIELAAEDLLKKRPTVTRVADLRTGRTIACRPGADCTSDLVAALNDLDKVQEIQLAQNKKETASFASAKTGTAAAAA